MSNYFLDFIIIPILLVASIVAFIRGFVKELSSFLTWIAAITISYLLSPYLTKFLAKSISSPTFASVLSGTILFILVMIIFGVLISKIFSDLSKKIPPAIDQSLGLIFGFTKYYLICSLVFGIWLSLYVQYFVTDLNLKNSWQKKKIGPSWAVNSYSYPFMRFGSDLLRPATDFILKDATKDLNKNLESFNNKINSPDQNFNINKSNLNSKDDLQKGYPNKEIEKMNRLIDVISE